MWKYLLKRSCHLIIALAAGQDENYEVMDMTKLVRRMRMLYGLVLEMGDMAAPETVVQLVPAPHPLVRAAEAQAFIAADSCACRR